MRFRISNRLHHAGRTKIDGICTNLPDEATAQEHPSAAIAGHVAELRCVRAFNHFLHHHFGRVRGNTFVLLRKLSRGCCQRQLFTQQGMARGHPFPLAAMKRFDQARKTRRRGELLKFFQRTHKPSTGRRQSMTSRNLILTLLGRQ